MELIQVEGWNCYVHLPAGYTDNPTRKYPTIIFFPGLGEVGYEAPKVIQSGVGAYITQGWNGEALGVKFIVICLQVASAWRTIGDVKLRVDKLRELYRIGDLTLTGLSAGGWDSLWIAYAYPNEVNRVVGVESVVPVEYAKQGVYDSRKDYVDTYRAFAQGGGKMLLFEQVHDYRKNDWVVDAMNTSVPGSAFYVNTNFGGGGHCCWNEFYGGQGKQPGRFVIEGLAQNIYEWIAGKILGVLPCFITSFSIKDNRLEWTCENLKPNDYFLIQKSKDGANFKGVANIPAKQNQSFYNYEV